MIVTMPRHHATNGTRHHAADYFFDDYYADAFFTIIDAGCYYAFHADMPRRYLMAPIIKYVAGIIWHRYDRITIRLILFHVLRCLLSLLRCLIAATPC